MLRLVNATFADTAAALSAVAHGHGRNLITQIDRQPVNPSDLRKVSVNVNERS